MTTYRDRALIKASVIWAYTHPGQVPTDEQCDEIRQATARQLLRICSDPTLSVDLSDETPIPGTPGTQKHAQEPTDV